MSEGLGWLRGRASSEAQESKARQTRNASLWRRCREYSDYGSCARCGKIEKVGCTKQRQNRKWDAISREAFQKSIRKKRKWDEICNEALAGVNVSIGEPVAATEEQGSSAVAAGNPKECRERKWRSAVAAVNPKQ